MTSLLWILPLAILAGRLAWDLYGLAKEIIIDNYIRYRHGTEDT